MSLWEHIRAGRDSGFSWCCILYFLIRCKLAEKTGLFVNYPTEIKNAGHVFCPFHYLYHLIVPVGEYHYCDCCRWQQYRVKTCNKCKTCKHSFAFNEAKCSKCDFDRYPLTIDYTYDKKTNQILNIKRFYD